MLREIMARIDAIRLDRSGGPEAERDDAERLRGSGVTGDHDWKSRGGMAAQQKSALEWFEKAQERVIERQGDKPEKSGLDQFRYQGVASRDRDGGDERER